jgi:hypothetical protein
MEEKQMAITPHLGIALVEQAQAQKEVTVNEAVIRLEALLNNGAIDNQLNTPPVSPADGDVYLVPNGATGAWSGEDQAIAFYTFGSWQFITPREGVALWVQSAEQRMIYDGNDWRPDGLINRRNGEFWRAERLQASASGLNGAQVTSALQLPDRALVLAVHTRVTTAITGAGSFSVGDASQPSRYGSGIGIAVDSTNVGVVTPTPLFSDTDILVTSDDTAFTGGALTLIAHYFSFRGNWDW